MSGPDLSRRALVAAALLASVGQGSAQTARAADALRVATVDWAVLETLLALGIAPVAATELVLFRKVAVEPAVPPGVVDLGLRGSPNLEALLLARPDLIFSSNFYAAMDPMLARIAPVDRQSVYRQGISPYEPAEAITRAIGARTGRAEAARMLVETTRAEIAQLRIGIAGADGRAFLLINLGDSRHFRVFGADSMFGAVAERLGLANAWGARTSYSASAPVGIETLARFPQAWIVIVPPVLPHSAFWRALPSVTAGRVLTLDPINPFGALPAAGRFARVLARALQAGGARGLG